MSRADDFEWGNGQMVSAAQTNEHVPAEREACASLTRPSSFCVVFDSVVEGGKHSMFPGRPRGKDENAKAAVLEYLRLLGCEGREAMDGTELMVEVNTSVAHKLLITVPPDGYLERT